MADFTPAPDISQAQRDTYARSIQGGMSGAAPTDGAPVLDMARLETFGTRLFAMLGTHMTDRRWAEEHWLRNLRQYRGIYDPEVLSQIPADCSKAYPKLTRWKCIGTVARLMQMLFPQTEKNYGIRASKLPDLSKDQLQEVLNALTQQAIQAQSQPGPDGTQPPPVDPASIQLQDDDIEKAIVDYAKGKAENMETKIQDDLDSMEFITLARRVVFSAVLYNVGVLKGPLLTKIKRRTWQKDPNTGQYMAIEEDAYRPLFEFLRVWDWYPDMTAKTLDKQDGTFERHVMTRQQVEELGGRPDYLKPAIDNWLREHVFGNHQPLWWETAMKSEPKSDQLTAQNTLNRKYELYSYWGGISGHDLRAAGVEIKDVDVGRTFQANAWIIDKTVIKARLAPLATDGARHHHEFMFEEDDLSLLGNGQCDTLRDSQLSVCETARAALDNVAVVGPMVEVNEDLLSPGQDTAIRKHKTWFREGEGASSQYPAVRDISIESHLGDLAKMMEIFMNFADKESGLPPPSLGDTSEGGSEALRTTQNASMFLGAAALPIRDTVRNYDTFTISVISSLVKWNTKYDPNPNRDGDHDVIARGATSLIAKEALGTALVSYKASLTPEDWPYFKRREINMEIAKAHDLPMEIFEDEAIAEQNVQAAQQAAQAKDQDAAALVHAQVEEMLTRADEHIAKAKFEDANINIATVESFLKMSHLEGDQAVQAAKALDALRPEPPKPAAKKK